MDYQEYQPHADLASIIKCYWTLKVVPTAHPQRQRILPDGHLEMVFILGDDIKRYTSEDCFIIQPRAMILGQITEPFFVEPTGQVSSFAVRFYPYGLASLIQTPIKKLANKETPLEEMWDSQLVSPLQKKVTDASTNRARIAAVEDFLMRLMGNRSTIDDIIATTIDTMISSKGSSSIKDVVDGNPAKRRQLERKFASQVGLSPKQLSKMIRLQSALKMMLEPKPESLVKVAYDSDYYDQAHFLKDFKEFTGKTPSEFFGDQEMELSSALYK